MLRSSRVRQLLPKRRLFPVRVKPLWTLAAVVGDADALDTSRSCRGLPLVRVEAGVSTALHAIADFPRGSFRLCDHTARQPQQAAVSRFQLVPAGRGLSLR